MLSGRAVALHKGSFCYLSTDGETYEDALCVIRSYEPVKQLWLVQHAGEEVLVPETSLRFCFSLLPNALKKFETYHKLAYEDAQGACGRGLLAGQDIQKGMPIFEERPLLVAFKSAASPVEHHEQRWRAYEMLVARANQEAKITTDRAWANALAAFDDLGISDHVPPHLEGSVAQIASADFRKAPHQFASAQAQAAHTRLITDTLMRFHCNQFGISNGATERDPAFAASAVYACTSRINHSCSPNVSMVTKETFCKQHRIACSVDRDGGVKMAVATRDIKQGERLTFSYQNEVTSPSMGVRERRALLLERLSFMCGCERCVAEATAAAEAEKEESAAATKPTGGDVGAVPLSIEAASERGPEAPVMPGSSGDAKDEFEPKSQQDEHEAPRRPVGSTHKVQPSTMNASAGRVPTWMPPLALAGAAAVVTIAVAMAVRRARGAM